MEDPEEWDAEHIKELIVQSDPNFYLVDARNPDDHWKVLWYNIEQSGRHCKVDILLPGPEHLDIPYIPDRDIYLTRLSQTPLVPLLTLILLKLKGWADHKVDHRIRMREKVEQDEEDIEHLLQIARRKGNQLQCADEEHLWEDWFWEESNERMNEYMDEWPETIDDWSYVFELDE